MTWGAAACLAGLLGLAGCGNSRPDLPVGAKLFAADCETCHSLTGNDSLRRVGGDLLGYRLSRRDTLELVGEMPARQPLTRAQILAVGDYVLGLERRAARPGSPAGS